MCEQGAALQNYNQELIKYIEQLKMQSADVDDNIKKHEKEFAELEKQLAKLQIEQKELSAALQQQIKLRDHLKQVIKESEEAYVKILESSQILLRMVKKESETVMNSKIN